VPAISAGILLYRRRAAGAGAAGRIEVLLVHPGGPNWAKKNAGAWSIPKGEADPDELGEARPAPARDAAWRRPAPAKPRLRAAQADLLAVAKREFREETGLDPDDLAAPGAAYAPLGGVKLRGHKIVYVWALEGDCDAAAIRSNEFEMEWPPRTGKAARFPEVDRAAWFDLAAAREKITAGQRRFLDDVALLGA
jgi:predicted NUDIX family NTP pyrophosphohydrolase